MPFLMAVIDATMRRFAMSWAFRLLALLVLAFIGFIGYGQILDYCNHVIITRDPSLVYGALLIQGFIPLP